MTVARAALVEWWPLVDVAQLKLAPGDTVVLRVPGALSDERREQLRAAFERAFPALVIVVVDTGTDFVVSRAMRELRPEDLEQPRRPTTME